jgi:hypothetical protein
MVETLMNSIPTWATPFAIAGMLTAGPRGQTPETNRETAQQAERMTVTGCVERADQVTQSGTFGATIDSLDFVLLEPKADSSAPQGSRVPTGTSGGTARPEANTTVAPKMYRLDGEVETLNAHVGHQVEIRGRLLAADPAPATQAPTDSIASAPTLKVEAVRMLAATCPR